jgi:hypothetical protein
MYLDRNGWTPLQFRSLLRTHERLEPMCRRHIHEEEATVDRRECLREVSDPCAGGGVGSSRRRDRVKNGIKMSGMPSFASAHSDDEIWEIVAFIRRLPQMTPAQYAELSRADTAG